MLSQEIFFEKKDARAVVREFLKKKKIFSVKRLTRKKKSDILTTFYSDSCIKWSRSSVG